MKFTPIDLENWKRKEYFTHYKDEIPCTYSMSIKLDITNIKEKQYRLYPTMIYMITTVIREYEEFRIGYNEEGKLGIFDELIPCYTIFHKDTETFSNLWTNYNENYDVFLKEYENDFKEYGDRKQMMAKPNVPINNFPISMIPWIIFEGFNLNLQKGYDYLLPIFTMGKYNIENGTYYLPLSVTVHHAVCDGFHISRFLSRLQTMIAEFDK